MGLLVDFALLLVTLLAVGVSIFMADFAKRQANAASAQAEAARDQVEAAREQADIAREQAEAAREQVAEARRANDLTESHYAEQRAQKAVVWEAQTTPGWEAVRIYNRGFDIARDVVVQAGGAPEDWEHLDFEHEQEDEVPPNEWVSYSLAGFPSPPDRLWVLWRGAGRPLAVEVESGPRPPRVIV